MKRIGKGLMTTSNHEFSGILRVVNGLRDVLQLAKEEDLSDVIIFSSSADVSPLAPILPRIKGVVCATGGINAHIAILSRAFDIPCVVRSDISGNYDLDQERVLVNSAGEVFLVEKEESGSKGDHRRENNYEVKNELGNEG